MDMQIEILFNVKINDLLTAVFNLMIPLLRVGFVYYRVLSIEQL